MLWYRSEEDIIRNLMDAGCDKKTADEFMELYHKGDLKAGCKLLESHRITLLDTCHCAEKQIDCLDYMLYKIEHKEDKIGE